MKYILIWKFPSVFSWTTHSCCAMQYCSCILAPSSSQSNWKHYWRNIMTCEHFVQHISTRSFTTAECVSACVCARVRACMHVSGLAPPPTLSFCLQARLLITDSSCFQRWQFRAANQSRGEQPCYLSQAGSLTPLLSPWTLPALFWQKETKKNLYCGLNYRCPDPVQRYIFRNWS